MPNPVKDVERSFKIAIALTFLFFFAEVAGGLVSNSLSLLSDAGHMFRDAFALILSYSAVIIAKKLPTKSRTFGYHRIEILAALFNSFLLLAVSAWILVEAVSRIGSPPTIDSPIMFAVSTIGLVVNLYIGTMLHGYEDINVKSAYFHVLTDALSSLIIVLGSVAIYFTGISSLDAYLSIVIVAIIIISSIRIIRPAMRILLEFSPDDVDFDALVSAIEGVSEVKDIHNIRLWSICSNVNAFDAHIVIDDQMLNEMEGLKEVIRDILKGYGIHYSTLEFECRACKVDCKLSAMEHCEKNIYTHSH